MMSSDGISNALPSDLISMSTSDIRTWLLKEWPPGAPIDENVGQTLASGAASKMTRYLMDEQYDEALSWASVVVEIRDRLSNARDDDLFALQAMHLRSDMIKRFGAKEGDLVRDPATVVSWFLGNTGMTIEDARSRAEQWSFEDWEDPERADEFRQLRRLRERIAILEQAIGRDTHDAALNAWLELGPRIP